MKIMISLLTIVVLSLLPGFEGRYAILAGVAKGLNPWLVYVLATFTIVILSMVLPTIICHLEMLAESILKFLRADFLLKIYECYKNRVRARTKKYIETWGFFGLILFVAVPLPATGVWTGSIAAHMLGMEKFRARLALMLGGIFSNSLVFLSILLGENIIKILALA